MALILVNAFFVAGEFSLVAVDRNRVERLAEEGGRRADRALRALRSLSFQLSGAQLGITVSSLVLGFIAEPTMAVVLEPLVSALPWVPEGSTLGVSIGLALALATMLQMVMGELVPKNLAIARPLGSCLAVAAPMQWVNGLLAPVIVFLNESANWTVRLLGIHPREELTGVRSLEELEVVIRSSSQQGEIDELELALLTRSIGFGEMIAAHAMTPRVSVIALAGDDPLEELRRVALESGHSRFPVYGESLEEIVGVVHVLDYFRVAPDQRGNRRVGDIAQPALVVPEARNLNDVLIDMQRERKQLAVVVDEYGGTAGIISAEDLLEEIVGEIEDEHDLRARSSRPEDGGVAETVPGLAHRHELREATGFEMPESRYETLAGFLIAHLGRFPIQGEVIQVGEWSFEVVAMEGYRIERVAVRGPLGREEPEES
ncbi:MAG: hemolysin family protein [Actinomycetota bacterium]|nr:hemolysin family protein [Actinomycetota bacterium]